MSTITFPALIAAGNWWEGTSGRSGNTRPPVSLDHVLSSQGKMPAYLVFPHEQPLGGPPCLLS